MSDGDVLDFDRENRHTFGHRAFRPGQREVVAAAMAGRDCFVLMPTGGGKSLCYQLPAWCEPGLAVVFSPLVSLIQDQVDTMNECGVRAAALAGGAAAARDDTLRELGTLPPHGHVKVLYLTPEKFAHSGAARLPSSKFSTSVTIRSARRGCANWSRRSASTWARATSTASTALGSRSSRSGGWRRRSRRGWCRRSRSSSS